MLFRSGTMVTDMLALLVLTIVVGMTTGEVNSVFWIRLGVSILLFTAIILFLFPLITRHFFKHVAIPFPSISMCLPCCSWEPFWPNWPA